VQLLVYLPLLIPALAAIAARPLAARLEPREATWLLTAATVVLAGCSTVALALLVASLVTKVIALWRLRHLMSVSTREVLPWRGLAVIVAAAVIAGLVSTTVSAQPHLPAIVRMALASVIYAITYGALGLWWGVWSVAPYWAVVRQRIFRAGEPVAPVDTIVTEPREAASHDR